MNEGAKTAIFGAVALATLGLAWLFRPESVASEQDEMADRVGQNVFQSFEDPDTASSMQIVNYDQELAQIERFEVARDSDSKLWTLPSHDGYPADAAEQVRNATTPLIGLNIMEVVSDSRGDHELYGVVSPENESLAAGSGGVGKLVTFKDEGDQVLASLVIGKEVDQVEGQRYVRIPTEDAVYKVEIDTSSLTTNFQDWIEGELLGIRSFDITKVGVRDYTLDQGPTQVTLARNFDATVTYNNSDNEWQLASMVKYEEGGPQPVEMAEDEELNSDFLNELKQAVQDLSIVDVQRKPTGLAADLKAEDALLNDRESIASLQQQGFFAAQGKEGTEIFAAGGETVIGTEEGVDYVLRFGEATASLSSIEEGDEDQGLSRYLLVTAKVDESKFPLPDLKPRPETIEEMLAMEQANTAGGSEDAAPANESGETAPSQDGDDTAEKDSAEAPAEEAPAEEAAAEEAAEADEERPPSPKTEEAAEGTDDAGTEDASKSSSSSEDESTEATSETKPEKNDASGGDGPDTTPDPEPQQASEEAQTESTEQSDEQSNSEAGETDTSEPKQAQTQDEQQTEAQPAEKPKETQEELQERLEALQEEIARENQRLIDERNEQIDAARKKVLELNARFSEWYYLVGDGVYQKLKISREDLIRKAGEGDEAEGQSQLPNFPGLPNGGLPPTGLPPQFNPNQN